MPLTIPPVSGFTGFFFVQTRMQIHTAWCHYSGADYTFDGYAKNGSVKVDDRTISAIFPRADLAFDYLALNQGFKVEKDYESKASFSCRPSQTDGNPLKDEMGFSSYEIFDSVANNGAIAWHGNVVVPLEVVPVDEIRGDNQIGIKYNLLYCSRNLLGKDIKIRNYPIRFIQALFVTGAPIGPNIEFYAVVEEDGETCLWSCKGCEPVAIGQGNQAERFVQLKYDVNLAKETAIA